MTEEKGTVTNLQGISNEELLWLRGQLMQKLEQGKASSGQRLRNAALATTAGVGTALALSIGTFDAKNKDVIKEMINGLSYSDGGELTNGDKRKTRMLINATGLLLPAATEEQKQKFGELFGDSFTVDPFQKRGTAFAAGAVALAVVAGLGTYLLNRRSKNKEDKKTQGQLSFVEQEIQRRAALQQEPQQVDIQGAIR